MKGEDGVGINGVDFRHGGFRELHVTLGEHVPHFLIFGLTLGKLLKLSGGGAGVVQLLEIFDEEEAGIVVVRIGFEGGFEVWPGFGEIIGFVEGDAEQGVGGGHGGIDLEAFFQRVGGLAVLVLSEVERAEVVVGGAKFGGDFEDLFVFGDGGRDVIGGLGGFRFGVEGLNLGVGLGEEEEEDEESERHTFIMRWADVNVRRPTRHEDAFNFDRVVCRFADGAARDSAAGCGGECGDQGGDALRRAG